MSNICRVCMEVSADLLALANRNSSNEIEIIKPGSMFEDCFGIEIAEVPDYLKICMNCKIQLSYFYDFKQQALWTHEQLQKLGESFGDQDPDTYYVAKLNSDDADHPANVQDSYNPEIDLYYEVEDASVKEDNDDDGCESNDETLEYLEDEEGDLFPLASRSPPSSKISVLDEQDEFPLEVEAVDQQNKSEYGRNEEDDDEVDEIEENEEEFHYEYDETIISEVTKKYRTTTKKTTRWKYRCDTCGKNFRNFEIYTGHMNVHQGLPAYRCEICSKDFKFKVNYDYHMKNHNNNRSFKCSVCEKTCLSKWDLKVHMRTHADIRPYMCNVCGKGFRVRSHMTDHVETHNDQNTYECTICSQKYKTKVTLKMHISTIHTKMQKFICKTCDKIFYRSHHLKIHQKVHTRNLEN